MNKTGDFPYKSTQCVKWLSFIGQPNRTEMSIRCCILRREH